MDGADESETFSRAVGNAWPRRTGAGAAAGAEGDGLLACGWIDMGAGDAGVLREVGAGLDVGMGAQHETLSDAVAALRRMRAASDGGHSGTAPEDKAPRSESSYESDWGTSDDDA
jgi:hypothetical protein